MLGSFFTGQRSITPAEISEIGEAAPIGKLEGLGIQFRNTLDRSLGGQMVDNTRIMNAEREAGQYDEDYAMARMYDGMFGYSEATSPLKVNHQYAMKESDWKASEWYRKDIEYQPDMTEAKAQYLANAYDKRKYEMGLVSEADKAYGLHYRALGIGSMFLAGVLDPINFIPFAGGVAKGAMVGKAATSGAIKAGVVAGAKTGAIDGAASAALSVAMTYPTLQAKGYDHTSFVDAMLEIVFGAGVGVGFGALGGGLAGWYQGIKGRNLDDLITRTRAELDAWEKANEFGSPDNGFLDRVPFSENAATAVLPRNVIADLLRVGLSGADRRDFFRAHEKAVLDFLAGRPVDVSGILRNSPALRNAESLVRAESERLGLVYDSVLDFPLAGHKDDILATVSPADIEDIIMRHGPAIAGADGSIVVKGRPVKRATGENAHGLVKILFRHGEGQNHRPEMPAVSRDDIISLPYLLRQFLPSAKANGKTTWRIPREDGRHLVIVAGKGQEGPNSRFVTMFVDDPVSSVSQRNPAFNSMPHWKSGSMDTDPAISVLTPDRKGGDSQLRGENLADEGPAVNFSTERIEDHQAPGPERMTPEQESSLAEASHAERKAAVDELYQQGLLDDTALADLRLAEENTARAATYNERGQAVLECVIGVAE